MSDEDLADLMMREAARAAPWGAVLLVVLLLGGMWLKQEIREGIEFASHTVIHDMRAARLVSPAPMERGSKRAAGHQPAPKNAH